MAFDASTYLRVILALGLSVSQAQSIQSALTLAETKPEVVTAVETTLTQIEEIETKLATEQSNANSGLIKADVLEWESSQSRTAGMKDRRWELQQKLAHLLGIEELLQDKILGLGTVSVGLSPYG